MEENSREPFHEDNLTVKERLQSKIKRRMLKKGFLEAALASITSKKKLRENLLTKIRLKKILSGKELSTLQVSISPPFYEQLFQIFYVITV